jgi:hypothetical protein
LTISQERFIYVSLEAPDTREYALEDPRSFLADLQKGAVIEGVEVVPWAKVAGAPW